MQFAPSGSRCSVTTGTGITRARRIQLRTCASSRPAPSALRPLAASAPDSPPAAVVPGLVEPLSERELEVLRLLAAGKPNQQIAQELVVTLHTVKKHVTHVLGKLGAANRTEATARARELGLLP